MNVQFGENDGYLQENGMPTIFVMMVNGKPMPVKAETTFGEFWKALARVPVMVEKEHVVAPLDMRPGQVSHLEPVKGTEGVIQRNDKVRFLGFLEKDGSRVGDDAGELVVDGVYSVLEVAKDFVALIDHGAPTPIRLTVPKSTVVLLSKGARATQIRGKFEITMPCICGETAVLTLEGDKYKGVCLKCKTSLVQEPVKK